MKVTIGIASEKKRDFLSWVVETVMMRDYSHIFVEYRGLMYHALPEGMMIEDYDNFKKDHDIVGTKQVELRCRVMDFEAHFEFHRKASYSHFQFLGMIPVIGKLFMNGRNRFWCSEYVAWVLSDLGHRWEFADADLSTPKLFERI